ncbi:MAG: T9SS type A sorting domain-containing protein [Bacteroidetes bacterium]|nr:T9SS type A sorting domain-containing protein [Bacteroidota bacterium]
MIKKSSKYLFFSRYKRVLQASNIKKIDEIEQLIKNNEDSLAMLKNAELQDEKQIDRFRKIVNEIYLSTFALDNYELSSEQHERLLSIALSHTPREGGEGVYIARYMLGVEINTNDNPNVQFAKGPGKAEPAEMLTTFPNPVTDNLCLSFNKAIEGGFVINVYNYAGLSVLTQTVSQTEAQHYLNVSKLTNGIYFFTVKTNTNTFKGKFTVIK